MKIGFNSIGFMPGGMGGLETYIKNLWHSLQLADTINHYTLLGDPHHRCEFPIFKDNFDFNNYKYSRFSFNYIARGIIKKIFDYDILKRSLKDFDADLIHHPFSFLNPQGLDLPSVLTFSDMQQEFYPEFFSTYQLNYRKLNYKSSAKQATRIIVYTKFTKDCLIERYDIDHKKIDVIPLGYSDIYHVVEDEKSLEAFSLDYGLDRPFMYYPAATWPHKNHISLLGALKLIKDRYGFEGDLILSGIAMNAQNDVMGEVHRLGLSDNVRILGYLPSTHLPFLYNLATLMVFPSFFEGFGLPLLEAMACACPIVCSNVTSIPEVVGDVGTLFNPKSVEDMAEKIWITWCSEADRQLMAVKGLERATSFNWDITAEKTLDVYRKVV